MSSQDATSIQVALKPALPYSSRMKPDTTPTATELEASSIHQVTLPSVVVSKSAQNGATM